MRLLAAMMAVGLSGCMGPEWTAPPEYADPTVGARSARRSPPIQQPDFRPHRRPRNASWEQVVAVMSDYFRIEHEEPIRMAGNTPTEGTFTTVPEVSPTIFEPWRHDTVDRQQRIENTLQTMRRRAVVHVIPAPEQGGHWVDVPVFKELEDNRHPDTPRPATPPSATTITLTRIVNPITGEPITKGWIAQGRDTSLEQYIIGDLLSRCGPPSGAPAVVPVQNAGSGPQGLNGPTPILNPCPRTPGRG